MSKLLLVEDDEPTARSVKSWLESDAHMVDLAHTGKSAQDHLYAVSYDLLILDWDLPDTTGLELLQNVRGKGSTVPVLVLTGHQDIEHKVLGFENGADDYLTKPFNHKELTARVKALLKRPATTVDAILQTGGLEIDLANYRVARDGRPIRLSPIEFNLLTTLARHPKSVLSADLLIERAWPTDSDITADAVRKYVQRLRDKIDVPTKPSAIKTVHGVGYSWEPDS